MWREEEEAGYGEEILEAKVAGAAFAKPPRWQDVHPTAAGAPKAVGLQVLSCDQLRGHPNSTTPCYLIFYKPQNRKRKTKRQKMPLWWPQGKGGAGSAIF